MSRSRIGDTVDLCPETRHRTAAVAVLARGMRDNPLNVAAYGEEPERRQRSLVRTFATLFRVFGAQRQVCALENVPFYERHHYAVIDEANVIGVPNWFMIRQPQPPD